MYLIFLTCYSTNDKSDVESEEVLVLITIVHLAEVGTNETIHHQETDETTCHHQTKE